MLKARQFADSDSNSDSWLIATTPGDSGPDSDSASLVFRELHGNCTIEDLYNTWKGCSILQQRAVSGGQKYDRVADMRKRCGVEIAAALSKHDTLVLLCRVICTTMQPADIAALFYRNDAVRERTTRQDRKLNLTNIRTEAGKPRFGYIRPWNTIAHHRNSRK